MGAAIKFLLTIVWDRDIVTTVDETVVADQRDLAAWEDEPFGTPYAESGRKGQMFTRYMGWHALNRTGRYKNTFKAFNRECMEVRGNAGDGAAQGEGVDPGQTDRSAER